MSAPKKLNSKKLGISLRLGLFLALRQIRRSSLGTTILIISVMTLTFLNLVVVSGILIGLIQGAVDAVVREYISDVIITPLKDKAYIENTPDIIRVAEGLPWVSAVSARYLQGGTVEANYKNRIKQNDTSESTRTTLTGINPGDENNVTNLSSKIVEGEYLKAGDSDKVLLGSMLLKKYFPDEIRGFTTLKDVKVGDKVRISANGATKEVTVKGIVKTKIDEVSMRVFMIDSDFRNFAGINDYSAQEVTLKLKPNADSLIVKNALIANGFDEHSTIQTSDEGQPKFIKDLIDTFALLGNMISSIGLAVASITIFIVIYINAITRRKFIGIMKGIGIDSVAIEFSYVIQSLFYAFSGTAIGMILLYGFLKPYFDANPIDFPFSDGILVATMSGTLIRTLILFIATIIAGYIPAKLVVRQNTLDSILGR